MAQHDNPGQVYADEHDVQSTTDRMLAAIAVQLARIAKHLEDQPAPVPECAHGARIHKSGDRDGKPWSGWFCPLPQARADERCEPVFDR